MSDKEAPVREVVELESGIEPSWVIFINIIVFPLGHCNEVLYCPMWLVFMWHQTTSTAEIDTTKNVVRSLAKSRTRSVCVGQIPQHVLIVANKVCVDNIPLPYDDVGVAFDITDERVME